MTIKNIAWKSDRETKFQNPDGNLTQAFKDFAKPPNWPRPVDQLDSENPENNGFQNQDFIVWMRTAAFPTFRKPYRKVIHQGTFASGLPKGTYYLKVTYSILFKLHKKHCGLVNLVIILLSWLNNIDGPITLFIIISLNKRQCTSLCVHISSPYTDGIWTDIPLLRMQADWIDSWFRTD